MVLLREATRFLAALLRRSEDLDPDAHDPQPDLVEPDYDGAAFAEALADCAKAGEDQWLHLVAPEGSSNGASVNPSRRTGRTCAS